MIERTIGAAAIGLLGLVAGCATDHRAERYYPLAAGRTWTYVLRISQGSEPEVRTVEVDSRVANLSAATFDGQVVTPQQTFAFGQTQTRLIMASESGVAEVATRPDPAGPPIPRVPPNDVLRTPLQVGASWQSSWRSNQLGQTTLIPMTKTVARIDGRITVPAGDFARCVVVSIRGRGTVTTATDSIAVEVEGEEWFAPDVGLVRGSFREEVPGRPANTTRVDLELSAYDR